MNDGSSAAWFTYLLIYLENVSLVGVLAPFLGMVEEGLINLCGGVMIGTPLVLLQCGYRHVLRSSNRCISHTHSRSLLGPI